MLIISMFILFVLFVIKWTVLWFAGKIIIEAVKSERRRDAREEEELELLRQHFNKTKSE
jgi:hypothetical protein